MESPAKDILAPPGWVLLDRRAIAPVPPYRLDLTVAVLRRTAGNMVDVWTEDGLYRRALDEGDGPLVTSVQQTGRDELAVTLYGPSAGASPTTGLDVATTLGTRVDLDGFYATAQRIPALWPTVQRACGVKPPRYPTLWEAVCNSVVFQQISLAAAMTVMRRIVSGLSRPVRFGTSVLYPFPGPANLLGADPAALRGWGLSASKASSLRDAAGAILSGHLSAADIEALPTEEAVGRLMRERGIGRWTAAVILLRGFQRLDVFPMADSGARRGLRDLLGPEYSGEDPDATRLLEELGPWRGMLYYHLLLRRLERHGEIDVEGNTRMGECAQRGESSPSPAAMPDAEKRKRTR